MNAFYKKYSVLVWLEVLLTFIYYGLLVSVIFGNHVASSATGSGMWLFVLISYIGPLGIIVLGILILLFPIIVALMINTILMLRMGEREFTNTAIKS